MPIHDGIKIFNKLFKDFYKVFLNNYQKKGSQHINRMEINEYV